MARQVPSYEQEARTAQKLEQIQKHPDAIIVAELEGQIVGAGEFWLFDDVHRIAAYPPGAKLTTWAKHRGVLEINDGGAKSSVPHVRLLERLGFELEPDWITFEKILT